MTTVRRISAVAAAAMALVGCGGSASSLPSSTDTATTETPAEPTSSGEHFTRGNWSLLDSDPGAHKGATINIVGRLLGAAERDATGVYFQMWADPKNSEWNTVVGYSDTSLNIPDGAYVRVKGEVRGKFEGTNAFGAKVVAPQVTATSVEVVDGTAAASPTTFTYGKAQFQQAGITVTVRKIEIADDETRAFIAVKNSSGSDFSIYSSSMRLVQGGRQIESTYSSGDYPQLSSDLLSGAFTSGVVVFPAIEGGPPVELHVEGNSDNSDVGEYGSLKWKFTW